MGNIKRISIKKDGKNYGESRCKSEGKIKSYREEKYFSEEYSEGKSQGILEYRKSKGILHAESKSIHQYEGKSTIPHTKKNEKKKKKAPPKKKKKKKKKK